MLKVETKSQQTIHPKDLTDKHFIGVKWKDGYKGFVQKIAGDKYIIALMDESANNKCSAILYDIESALRICYETEIVATLDYQEFKDWYFNS